MDEYQFMEEEQINQARDLFFNSSDDSDNQNHIISLMAFTQIGLRL